MRPCASCARLIGPDGLPSWGRSRPSWSLVAPPQGEKKTTRPSPPPSPPAVAVAADAALDASGCADREGAVARRAHASLFAEFAVVCAVFGAGLEHDLPASTAAPT